MNTTRAPRRIGRSIWALFAGFLAVVILSIGADIALRAAGIFPPLGQAMPDTLFLLATVCRTVFGVVGSYITARLAPDRPMQHALLGGLVGLFLSVVGAITTWSRGAEFGPHWYPLSLIVLALPTAWLGGRLRLMQLRSRSA